MRGRRGSSGHRRCAARPVGATTSSAPPDAHGREGNDDGQRRNPPDCDRRARGIIGESVSIGPYSIVHANAVIEGPAVIGASSIIGYSDLGSEPAAVTIGAGARIRSHTVIYGGSSIGPRLETGHRVTIREQAEIGVNLRVGTLSDIQGHCVIGDYVRLHSNVHVSQATTIGSFVWIFPYTVVTNDPHPPSDGLLQGVTIEDYAVIATRATVLPGLRVGKDSFVAANALVNRDVREGALVAGIPAKDRGDASQIQLGDGSGPAYPWRRHFRRGYPPEIVAEWEREFPGP